MSSGEWSTKLRLLLQAEAEAAHAVAAWAVELEKLALPRTPGSQRALESYVIARTHRETFLAEVRFP